MAATLSRSARLHARLIRRLVPILGPDEASEAARVFDELRRAARHRSRRARVAVWMREAGSLAMTAWSERRDARRRSRTGVPDAAWPGSPVPGPPGRHTRSAGPALERLGRELRQSVGHLARTPLFTSVAVLSLALGMAAAVAVFSVANTLLWQPPPHVSDPDSLVRLVHPDGRVWSYLDAEDARAFTPALAGAATYGGDTAVLTPPGGPSRRTIAAQVSADYFDVVGVAMPRGRGFRRSDLDQDDVAVVGAGLWRRGYGSREDVLGQRVEVNGRSLVIVGVAPAGLRLLDAPVEPDVWYLVPREQRENRGWGSLQVIGRLAPDASLAELRVQLASTAARLRAERPAGRDEATADEAAILAYPEREARLPLQDRGVILAGMGGVLLVIFTILALAASNVTSMMLTRVSERRPEFALRLALGATRRHLVEAVITESLLVTGLAGGLALLGVVWLFDVLAAGAILSTVPAPLIVTLDARVAAFAAAVSLVTGLGFGLGPALDASTPDVLPALKGVRPSTRLRRFGARSLIVTAQVAVSLALVVTSVLFLRSSRSAQQTDLGFDPNGVAVVPIDLTSRQYGAEAAAAFFAEAADRLARVPGVERFTFARTLPLSGTNMLIGDLDIAGSADTQGRRVAVYNIVGPGYFAIVRMPLVAGREFSPEDRDGAPAVAIVNEAFVARYWGGASALGRRVEGREVVGVVRNAVYRSPGEPPQPHLWAPVAQSKERTLFAVARVTGDPKTAGREMAHVVSGLEPALLIEATTMRELTSASTLGQRVLSLALGAAGLAALALAMMGVYGVMAYVVSLRTREMGIRVALGASPATLAAMVVREGLGLVALGLVAGIAIAGGVAVAAQAMLVGVSPLDPVSLLAGAGLLGVAAIAASYLPARRAARVDPMVSLRAE